MDKAGERVRTVPTAPLPEDESKTICERLCSEIHDYGDLLGYDINMSTVTDSSPSSNPKTIARRLAWLQIALWKAACAHGVDGAMEAEIENILRHIEVDLQPHEHVD